MTYRILATGSREFDDRRAIVNALWSSLIDLGYRWGTSDPPILVHGECPSGADAIASEVWQGWGFPEEAHPADWSIGRKAGPLRNQAMVDAGADLCIAFFKRTAKNVGTRHCSGRAKAAGIVTKEVWS